MKALYDRWLKQFNDNPLPYLAVLIAFGAFMIIYMVGVKDNPVFAITPSQEQNISWESKEEPREVRNIAKMNRNYNSMMAVGDMHLERREFDAAAYRFFFAKTLFPERIGARKKLCRAYLGQCIEYPELCHLAQKEIYYAHRYVDDDDSETKRTLLNMASTAKIEDLIDKSEAEAMSMIYSNEVYKEYWVTE